MQLSDLVPLGWVVAAIGMVVHTFGGIAGLWRLGEVNVTWWLATVGYALMFVGVALESVRERL